MNLFDKLAAEFGTATIKGKAYALTREASRTNRAFAGSWETHTAEGEEYIDEFSAPGIDADENEVVITWQFTQVRGQEGDDDTLDWDNPHSVIYA